MVILNMAYCLIYSMHRLANALSFGLGISRSLSKSRQLDKQLVKVLGKAGPVLRYPATRSLISPVSYIPSVLRSASSAISDAGIYLGRSVRFCCLYPPGPFILCLYTTRTASARRTKGKTSDSDIPPPLGSLAVLSLWAGLIPCTSRSVYYNRPQQALRVWRQKSAQEDT